MNLTINQSDKLVTLVYSSQIKPAIAKDQVILNSTTTAILGQANKNNQGKDLTGVLYYGHKHFFQCIEGPKKTVQKLYKKIKNDRRHEQIKLLLAKKIPTRRFGSWHMKFVDNHQEISAFFSQQGLNSFEPGDLDTEKLLQFIRLLQQL